jgi:ATP-dependent DNA helicase RecG
MSRLQIQAALGLKGLRHFREDNLIPALSAGLLEMTIPNSPNSRLQKYRLTQKGRMWIAAHAKGWGPDHGGTH